MQELFRIDEHFIMSFHYLNPISLIVAPAAAGVAAHVGSSKVASCVSSHHHQVFPVDGSTYASQLRGGGGTSGRGSAAVAAGGVQPLAWRAAKTLVERFDIEPYSDFSAK